MRRDETEGAERLYLAPVNEAGEPVCHAREHEPPDVVFADDLSHAPKLVATENPLVLACPACPRRFRESPEAGVARLTAEVATLTERVRLLEMARVREFIEIEEQYGPVVSGGPGPRRKP